MPISYDEELQGFIRDMEEEERADLFKRESELPLGGRRFDDLTEEQFLAYAHARTSRCLQEFYAGHEAAGQVIGLQNLFDLARRRRNLGPDLADAERYDLGGLERLRGRPGPVE